MIESAIHPAESPEFLSRLHDGELPEDEAAAFESHRSECNVCRAAVVEFERALFAYRAAPEAPVASDLSARILKKIRAASPSRRPFGVTFGIDIRWAGALVAALLVVIIGAPVFSRRPVSRPPASPVSSAPIPAYVLDAEDERPAPAPPAPSAEIRVAPKAEAPAAPAKPAPARRDEPAFSAAPPPGERENAASEQDDAVTAAPPAPLPEAQSSRADAQKEASTDPSARRLAASAPAGKEAGAASSAEPPPAVRLTIWSIDGHGQAPELAKTPPDERLAALKGQQFVLVVESGGRVRAVEKPRSEQKVAKDKSAADAEAPASSESAEVILRELVFRPGDRSRRLTVAVE
jgi:anti-sigma factor RsiW